VEIDLMNAKILPDITHGTNIYLLRPYETYQWWYHRKFDTPMLAKGERLELVFEGLDCIADVWVNGRMAGHADNMLIDQRFDVTPFLKPAGENGLHVRIRSVVLEGRKYEVSPFQFSHEGSWESLSIRKAPHGFGWDIMPRLLSAGIWRDVYLEKVQPTRFRSVYWATMEVDTGAKTANLFLDFDLTTDRLSLDQLAVKATLAKEGRQIYAETIPVVSAHGRAVIPLKGVDFWWPKGYGRQPLYEAGVSLEDENGHVLAVKKEKIGIRTIKLKRTEITTPQAPGEFVFLVNGEKIFVKGTNWVPLDGLHSRDKLHLGKMFDMLNDLNCNMVRCWGGNVYEDDEFYDLCDRNGVMVWQDFALGCARYPQDDEFAAKMEKEATFIVKKFRNRASLALWAGDNEIDVSRTWMVDMTQHDPNLDRISRQVLAGVVRDQDPLRDYLPSSPYVSPEVFKAGFNLKMMPEVHLWGPRGYYKADFYTDVPAHFVSEIGYHGCPDRSSLERMFDRKYVEPDYKNRKWNEQWQAKAVVTQSGNRTKSHTKRNDLMPNQVEALFGILPDRFDDFIFASQATQAEAKKFFIEFWRSQKFQKTGILWWNLRDGWPILSDAIVDYYFSKKLAYDYIKRVQADVCAMIIDAKEGRHPVVVVNDSLKPVRGTVAVVDADTGRELFHSDFSVEENGKTTAGFIPETGSHEMWLIQYELEDGQRHMNHYLSGKAPFRLEDYKRWFRKLKINNSCTEN
jgi:beta-mannosidase